MFSSGQPIPGKEDCILQSKTPISQQTQASISSLFHEEVTSVLGDPKPQSFNSSNSTPLQPGNFLSNEGQWEWRSSHHCRCNHESRCRRGSSFRWCAFEVGFGLAFRLLLCQERCGRLKDLQSHKKTVKSAVPGLVVHSLQPMKNGKDLQATCYETCLLHIVLPNKIIRLTRSTLGL